MAGSTVVAPRPPLTPPLGDAEERSYYAESRRVYGSWFASIYDLIVFPLRRLRRQVARIAGIESGGRMIDVATGTGAQARAFGDAGATVVGLDLSPRMLAIARRKNRNPNVIFVEGDATAIPAADASFDVACISFALHEMPAGVRTRAVGELARVTRPGGTIVIVDYAPPRNRLWRWLVVRVVALFERDSYTEFVHADLHELLARARIAVHHDRRALLGVARIVIGRREG